MDFVIHYHRHREKAKSETEAVYQAIREAIIQGTLKRGVRLPSTRELAVGLGLSRGTVNLVYEMLAAEGYVEAAVGRGTFVAYDVGKSVFPASGTHADVPLSEWGRRMTEAAPLAQREIMANTAYEGADASTEHEAGKSMISFTLQGPDISMFPMTEWKRVMYAQVREVYGPGQADGCEAAGYLPLREAIARMLGRARGIQADAQDIAIVHGSMQAIFLLAQLLLQSSDRAIVEEPGYGGIYRAVRSTGADMVAAPVDEQGLVPKDWEAKLLFVTAGRQFPTGAVLSMARRQQLLRWASRTRAFIVEDDYDSEFRYRGKPVEPLKALDTEGRVVYIGSFSKSMPAALRIGYAVLPPGLRRPFVQAQRLAEPHASGLAEQRALAAFLNEGSYEKHLRRMKRIYARRRELLRMELNDRLSQRFKLFPADAGLHLFARWNGNADEYKRVLAACRQAGVEWTDGAAYYVTAGHPPAACFGFAHLHEEQISRGVQRIQQVLNRMELLD
ncbi:PLP-dependent aminotransferase family protein [Xylanibacillus composti]|uniref:GntR family transcriptional regulator n=1 Tax=Xylanibacillus composti TaxID=1572762 RepID=A0A8J4M0R8_9BACL|nr:PLP-dependent aminotransferase family protein [Xylanibacillus composti]MDT9723851.1 PLP-dependent aminotransferase family protein [Xylanibacillus composti]GIQ67370.1 GntR family transcriptional regulator [Xylanibacillus composti]